MHASSGTTGSRPWSGYTQEDIDTWADLMARSIRAAGGRPGDLVHVAYGYGLFTGGLGAHYGAERLGCTVVPVSGGMTERQVQLIVDFGPRVIMVTPSYFLAILDEMDRQGVDPRSTSLEVGIFGAEPWTDEMRRAVEAALGHPGGRHLRAVGGDGAGRLAGGGGDPGRPARVGGPLPPRGRRPGDAGAGARRRARRAGVHLAHQAGDAGGALPHPRPDPAAARHRLPVVPADGEGHRPHRRHDDRARRERLPEPDRGADPRCRGTDAALPLRADPTRQPRRADRAGRGRAGVVRRRARRPAGGAHQAADRCDRPGRGAGAVRAGALARQGEADQRPAGCLAGSGWAQEVMPRRPASSPSSRQAAPEVAWMC